MGVASMPLSEPQVRRGRAGYGPVQRSSALGGAGHAEPVSAAGLALLLLGRRGWSRGWQAPDHLRVSGHMLDMVDDLPDRPDVVGGPAIENLGVEVPKSGLIASGQASETAGGLVQVSFGEPREVGVGGDHPPVPLVGHRRLAGQTAFDLSQVVKQVIGNPAECLMGCPGVVVPG